MLKIEQNSPTNIQNTSIAFSLPHYYQSMITQCMTKVKKSLRYLSLLNHPSNQGFCSICNQKTLFVEYGSWLRSDYRCIKCQSVSRSQFRS